MTLAPWTCLVLACALAGPAAAQAAPSPPACTAPAHRQFDFWLGAWEVTNPAGQRAGDSRIESILDGCVVQEQWTSAKAPVSGRSFNLYNTATGQWEQFWVDNAGTRLHLLGGLEGGAMVLRGVHERPDPKTGIVQQERVTWTPNADGSVRQRWESSTDGGAHWQTVFDGLYRHPAAH